MFPTLLGDTEGLGRICLPFERNSARGSQADLTPKSAVFPSLFAPTQRPGWTDNCYIFNETALVDAKLVTEVSGRQFLLLG